MVRKACMWTSSTYSSQTSSSFLSQIIAFFEKFASSIDLNARPSHPACFCNGVSDVSDNCPIFDPVRRKWHYHGDNEKRSDLDISLASTSGICKANFFLPTR